MPFQPAVNCSEIVINAVAALKPLANVLNAYWPFGYMQADLDNLSSLVDAVVAADYIPWIGAQVTYLNTTVRGLTSAVDLISIDNTGTGPGTLAGQAVPNNVTMCFRLNTGFTGRSARGRFYALPATIGQLATANTWGVGYTTGVNTFLDNVQAACVSAGCVLSVLSRQNAGVVLAAAVARTVLSIDFYDNRVDSQRSRLP